VLLNQRLAEMKRKISAAGFVRTEDAIATIMNRLNKVAALAKGLLLHTCSLSIPPAVLRCVMKQGVVWTDTSVLLFPFLNDARQCDGSALGHFLEFSRCIKRQLQIVVDHVPRNELSLQPLLPSVSKALASWSYSLRSAIRWENNEVVKIQSFRERTLLGELILSHVVGSE
jgi:hypothetical protein